MKRSGQIDLVKALAICCVAVIHCGYYGDPAGSFGFGSAVFWGSLVRAAVPLFLMCSGALLLPPERELPLKRLLGHNVLRLLIAMWFWAMVYKLWYLLPEGLSAAALWQAVKEVLLFRQEFHFYYIHIMLLVYLFLPVSRVFVRAAGKRELEYALGFWFALGILYPLLLQFWPLKLLSGFPLQWALNMTYAAVGYGLLGYYLRKYPLSTRLDLLLLLIGFALTFGGTLLLSARDGALNELCFGGMSPGVCLMAAGIYGLAGQIAPRLRHTGAVAFLSKGSFCIYLVHVLFRYGFQRIGFSPEVFGPRILSIPLTALAIIACSALVYALLRKLPAVNRWLI